MTQIELKSKGKYSPHSEPILIVGLCLLAGFCPIVLEMSSLLIYILWAYQRFNYYSILSFYIPQIGIFILLLAATSIILKAVRNLKLGYWKTYLPFMMLGIYCGVMFLISHIVLFGYAIPTKITNPDNRIWTESMVSRALGDYPTGILDPCVLSDKVVALIDVWSFVTPDNKMPALIWTESAIPDRGLPGNPLSCTQLQKNWYLCYLNKPYQLVQNHQFGYCDFRGGDH